MDGPATLIGRESERATLRSAVNRAALGEPGLLLVHGEAGIGKTSLVREASRAALADMSVGSTLEDRVKAALRTLLRD